MGFVSIIAISERVMVHGKKCYNKEKDNKRSRVATVSMGGRCLV